MLKKNNLRKVYMAYLIAIGEVVCISILVCAGYTADSVVQSILRWIGYAGIVLVPIITFVFYKLLKKDNASASDELERTVLRQALAVTGMVSITLAPVLVVLACVFGEYAGLIALIYAIAIWGTCKFSVLYYHRKY